MTEVSRKDIYEMCLSHFNEPIIVCFDVVRLIGYGEDDSDCYLICQHPEYPDGKTVWHTAVGGYVFLDRLKGQDHVRSTHGEEWDDFTRLDNFLSLNGAPRAKEFKVVIEQEKRVYPCSPILYGEGRCMCPYDGHVWNVANGESPNCDKCSAAWDEMDKRGPR
jgi:hypothetical protein